MASRIKGRGSHALDQLEYDIFWTEYRAINESRPELSEEEHEDDPQKEPPCGMSQTYYLQRLLSLFIGSLRKLMLMPTETGMLQMNPMVSWALKNNCVGQAFLSLNN